MAAEALETERKAKIQTEIESLIRDVDMLTTLSILEAKPSNFTPAKLGPMLKDLAAAVRRIDQFLLQQFEVTKQ